MGPIDYSINVQTPFQAAMQGYQAGAAIRDDQAQQAAKQAAVEAQRLMSQDLRALSMNPNATGADYAAMMTRYPQLSENLTRSWSTLNDTQKQNNLSTGSQVYAAARSGRPDLASDILKRQAEAKRNSGDERGAAQDEALAKVLVEHPEIGRNMVGLSLSAIMGPEKFATTYGTLGEEARKQEAFPTEQRIKVADASIKEAEAGAAPERLATDVANVRDQIADRSRRFNLDQDKLTSEMQLKLTEMRQKWGEIPESVGKEINEATVDSMSAEQSAGKMESLADQLSKSGGAWQGSAGTAAEWLKKATGNQNEMTRLRAEYNRIVTPAAMSAYKRVASGSTSDRDIDTAMKGVPPDTAKVEEMASFLRGVSKLQRMDAVVNNAKSEWLGAVKNLGKARSDIEIDGVQVPAGTSFKNFADQYVEQKMARQTADRNRKQVESRGYMTKYSTPQQPVAAPGGPSDMSGVLPVTGGL